MTLPVRAVPATDEIANYLPLPPRKRELTREERAVKREARTTLALQRAYTEAAINAAVCKGEIDEELSRAFVKTTTNIITAEEEITHPRVQPLAHRFNENVLDLDYKHLLGFSVFSAQNLAETMSRDMSPPPPRPLSRWQRLIGATDE